MYEYIAYMCMIMLNMVYTLELTWAGSNWTEPDQKLNEFDFRCFATVTVLSLYTDISDFELDFSKNMQVVNGSLGLMAVKRRYFNIHIYFVFVICEM